MPARLARRRARPQARRGRAGAALARTALAMMILVLVQIALGGLVAGSKAGLTYNTWPLMMAASSPAGLFSGTPGSRTSSTTSPGAVQPPADRLRAADPAILPAVDARAARPGTGAARRATALAGLVAAQASLGIVTLLLVVPLWAGLAHQVAAMLVLGMRAPCASLPGARRDPEARAPPYGSSECRGTVRPRSCVRFNLDRPGGRLRFRGEEARCPCRSPSLTPPQP